ncbi:MAG: hypothetical protein DRN53_01130 [Thermoprotei archaeon]|nr:MAG: hypothetical protein DRN53_01130 [Thermoprotei archaeon]
MVFFTSLGKPFTVCLVVELMVYYYPEYGTRVRVPVKAWRFGYVLIGLYKCLLCGRFFKRRVVIGK